MPINRLVLRSGVADILDQLFALAPGYASTAGAAARHRDRSFRAPVRSASS